VIGKKRSFIRRPASDILDGVRMQDSGALFLLFRTTSPGARRDDPLFPHFALPSPFCRLRPMTYDLLFRTGFYSCNSLFIRVIRG